MWSLEELGRVRSNGRKVFSTFACGGGSSMGYKLAGYEVVGHCEIDPRLAEMYRVNHHPRYSFTMDIRELVRLPELPEELYRLDILDGSPPCSVFSVAGQREKGWGLSKQFREGQAVQTLDDLFFEFIALVDRLKPKVVVAENVKGLIKGNAKGYVHEILVRLAAAGYAVQLFCLNAARMGVPQRRERVFFIGHRNDLDVPPLKLDFREEPIPFGKVRSVVGTPVAAWTAALLRQKISTDMNIGHINERLYRKTSDFNSAIVWDDRTAPTIMASGGFYRAFDNLGFSDSDFIECQTFPHDYDFCGESVQFVCGMSVPPLMMRRIAEEIERQWFKK